MTARSLVVTVRSLVVTARSLVVIARSLVVTARSLLVKIPTLGIFCEGYMKAYEHSLHILTRSHTRSYRDDEGLNLFC